MEDSGPARTAVYGPSTQFDDDLLAARLAGHPMFSAIQDAEVRRTLEAMRHEDETTAKRAAAAAKRGTPFDPDSVRVVRVSERDRDTARSAALLWQARAYFRGARVCAPDALVVDVARHASYDSTDYFVEVDWTKRCAFLVTVQCRAGGLTRCPVCTEAHAVLVVQRIYSLTCGRGHGSEFVRQLVLAAARRMDASVELHGCYTNDLVAFAKRLEARFTGYHGEYVLCARRHPSVATPAEGGEGKAEKRRRRAEDN